MGAYKKFVAVLWGDVISIITEQTRQRRVNATENDGIQLIPTATLWGMEDRVSQAEGTYKTAETLAHREQMLQGKKK